MLINSIWGTLKALKGIISHRLGRISLFSTNAGLSSDERERHTIDPLVFDRLGCVTSLRESIIAFLTVSRASRPRSETLGGACWGRLLSDARAERVLGTQHTTACRSALITHSAPHSALGSVALPPSHP